MELVENAPEEEKWKKKGQQLTNWISYDLKVANFLTKSYLLHRLPPPSFKTSKYLTVTYYISNKHPRLMLIIKLSAKLCYHLKEQG